jgi:transcriptional regulator with XRE-family HTH domain
LNTTPPKKVSNTLQPAADKISKDRIDQGFTQEALLERCRALGSHFSIQSLRRAERGERVNKSTLEGGARALGKDLIHYLPESDQYEQSASNGIEGEWHALSIEDDRLSPPYILEETMVISSDAGGALEIICHALDFHRTEPTRNVVKIGDMLMGQIFITEWDPPLGYGSFQLQILRENTFLEGFVTWYDSDSRRIEASRYLAVRKDIPDFDACVEAAKAMMDKEIEWFASRKHGG